MSNKEENFLVKIGAAGLLIFNAVILLFLMLFKKDKNKQEFKNYNLWQACHNDLVFFVWFYLLIGADIHGEYRESTIFCLTATSKSFNTLRFLKNNKYLLTPAEIKLVFYYLNYFNEYDVAKFVIEEMNICVECLNDGIIQDAFENGKYELVKLYLMHGVRPDSIKPKNANDKKLLKQFVNEIENS